MSCPSLRSTHRVTFPVPLLNAFLGEAPFIRQVANGRQGSTERSVHFDCLTLPKASPIIAEETGDDSRACFQPNEGRWVMPTAVKVEVSPETIIRAVKRMKKSVRQVFLEDLIAAASPEYLQSIREARRDFKGGRVKSHGEVFGR